MKGCGLKNFNSFASRSNQARTSKWRAAASRITKILRATASMPRDIQHGSQQIEDSGKSFANSSGRSPQTRSSKKLMAQRISESLKAAAGLAKPPKDFQNVICTLTNFNKSSDRKSKPSRWRAAALLVSIEKALRPVPPTWQNHHSNSITKTKTATKSKPDQTQVQA